MEPVIRLMQVQELGAPSGTCPWNFFTAWDFTPRRSAQEYLTTVLVLASLRYGFVFGNA
jgi:hypothetical protein